MRIRSLLFALLGLGACGGGEAAPSQPLPPGGSSSTSATTGAGGAGASGVGGTGAGTTSAGGAATGSGGAAGDVTIGAWNLHHFSPYGAKEFRIPTIAQEIQSLGVDVLAVEEIEIVDGSNGAPPQAWDALLEALPGFEGVRNAYDPNDTTVGLIYDKSTTTIGPIKTLFEGDWYAFPRPPLEVPVVVTKAGASVELSVIVVHLKAFKDSVARRRDACQKLDQYMQAQADKRYLVVGDYNDDPYDPPAENSFTGTFLDAEPKYHFVTAVLPPETVTSLGYYHYVDGQKLTGEFLDHAIATDELWTSVASMTPKIVALPESEFAAWEGDYSDHFPLLVQMAPIR